MSSYHTNNRRPASQRGQRQNNHTNTNTNTTNTNTRDLYDLLDTYSELYRLHIQELIDIKNTMNTITQTILSNSSNNIGNRHNRRPANTNQTTAIFPPINMNMNTSHFDRFRPVITTTPTQSAITRTSNTIVNDILRSFLDPVPIRPTREQINAATTVRRFGDIEQPVNSSCPICMDVFNVDDVVTQLFCGHIFTSSEIGRWFESHTRCPLCNVDIRDVRARPSSNTNTNTTTEEEVIIENDIFQDLHEQTEETVQQPLENSRPPILTNERISNALTDGLMSWLLGDVDIGLSRQLPNGTNNTYPQWNYVGNDASGSIIFETFLHRPPRQSDP